VSKKVKDIDWTEVDPVSMRKGVQRITRYWESYHTQHDYDKYPKAIFLEDALYAIGMAIDNKRFAFGDGYRDFIKQLTKYLEDRNNL
jgi:hypothetical protein